MRHVARTHRVDLDWLFERIRDDPGIFLKYVNTKEQLADMLTKGQFTAESWKYLLNLAQIGQYKSPNSAKNIATVAKAYFARVQPRASCSPSFAPKNRGALGRSQFATIRDQGTMAWADFQIRFKRMRAG